ncbi:MAG: YcaO-like family protein [Beijerinckiaceae bacterium]
MSRPRIISLTSDVLRDAGERAGLPPALLALLPRFGNLFALVSADAPGLACFGGELRLDAAETAIHGRATMSATGAGFDPAAALTSLLGEAADLLSPFEREGDLLDNAGLPAVAGGWMEALVAAAGGPLDWVAGRDVASDASVRVPADLALRRAKGRRRLDVRHALSSGVAAGATAEAALERATLELIERDAMARWWQESTSARGLAEGSEAAEAFGRSLARLRGNLANRPAIALILPSPAGVPVAAVVSRGMDGRGLACGAAARGGIVAALDAALVEMAQMEMSAPVARMKAESVGEDGLDAADRRHLDRATLDVLSLPQLRPSGRPITTADAPMVQGLIASHVAARGIALTAVNLSRADIGVAAMRAMSPDLRPFVFTEGVPSPY